MSITRGGRHSADDIYSALEPKGKRLRSVVSRPRIPTGLETPTALSPSVKVRSYTWRQGDRIDTVAWHLLGDSRLYWKILDLNPDIMDPMAIPAGRGIVVPSA